MSNQTNGYLALLDKNREELQRFLPTYLDVERFVSNAKTIAGIRELQDCTPESMYNAALDAAKRGLEVGGPNKHCAVVAFKSTAVLIVQWQGKSFLWHRAGAIRKLLAEVVYEGDEFSFVRGDADRIIHKPDFKTKRDPKWLNNLDNIVGAYSIAWLTSGERSHMFVNQSQLNRLREWVKAKNNNRLGFGWENWLPEMCKKTAVHRQDGIIQPPPNADAIQLEAWQRSSIRESSFGLGNPADYEDAAIVGDGHAGDNLPPTPAETKNGKVADLGEKRAERKVETKRDEPEPPKRTEPDRQLTREEVDRIVELRTQKGIKNKPFVTALEKAFDLDDPSDLMLSQLPEVEQIIAGWQNQ